MSHNEPDLSTNPKILVVTVAFRSLETLRAWYRLEASPQIRIVIVDNFGEPGLEDFARQIGAELLHSGANIGFGRGCNLGIDLAEDEEWVALVNPDASVTGEQLVDLTRGAGRGVVACSPVLVDEEGEPHGDMFRRLPTPRSTVATWLAGSRSRLARRNFVYPDLSQERVHVEVTSGSCLLVWRQALKLVGGFPNWIFLNQEDIYLCRELGRLGSIEVNTTVCVPHQKLSAATVVPTSAIRAETARACAAYTLMVSGFWAWLAVAFATVLGFALRYPTNLAELAKVPRLAKIEIYEALALMRARDFEAGPVFVPRNRVDE